MADDLPKQDTGTRRPGIRWDRLLPARWRGMPFIYMMLAPAGIGVGSSGMLHVLGVKAPGVYFDPGLPGLILGGTLGIVFGSLLWLTEGLLILLRRRAGLWVLWGALAYTYVPGLWLPPAALGQRVSAFVIPVFLGGWAWLHRRWFVAP